ncbi:MAG: phenylalanine--tRNA ligase subunit beta [Anaerolineales bacterium]|nr:phenylalanine--tRNA ligase subunit beta [Anaerolineales bacterium]
MKVPLSWLKDFVEITLPIEELAHLLTMAGLEVEEITYIGLPMPEKGQRQETKITGFTWEPDKIVVGAIHEVMPHPNADRLVLCRLEDGLQEQIVLTGAPNLFPYKGIGPLPKPIMVAYAKEGAQIYDGHQAGQVLVTLKRAKIRGVESYSMACSEKELGISDEHSGIIFLDDDARPGMPLVDYMGDAVFDIAITPNIARDANILGVAREVSALTGQPLRPPSWDMITEGPPIEGSVAVEIREPELNPRFVVGLIEGIEIKPSPYKIQRRLRLAGMRPINNIVDATNYVMLEVGQPLHAFNYDALVKRVNGKTPTIITRRAIQNEKLTTLDDVERTLDDFSVMVCDTEGSLSIAGVMGGEETEVNDETTRILLEGAAWNYINIRRTLTKQKFSSEAGYRFSRGVHPEMAIRGVCRGLELMRQLSGGKIRQGLVDNYPLPAHDPVVEITTQDVERWLGISLSTLEMADILKRLEFDVEISDNKVKAKTPDHRMDIGEGVVGMADILEEIARIYGYERIPETRMSDELPPQRDNPYHDLEEHARDILVNLGLQEVVSYRMTSPEREARRFPLGTSIEHPSYIKLANAIVSERVVLRQSVLGSVLETVERNARLQPRLALFEIGPVFLPVENQLLPDEPRQLVIALSGSRTLPGWQPADTTPMDFFDIKGVIHAFLEGLHMPEMRCEPGEHPTYHPGKCACLWMDEKEIGVFGELHPLLREQLELPEAPVLAAELDLDAILAAIPQRYAVEGAPAFPPVLEDLAVVVDENVPADSVASLIKETGGKTVIAVRLFDVYRDEKIGAGKKSLAYSVTYQLTDRTLTDKEVAKIRQRIVRQLEQQLDAKLRS